MEADAVSAAVETRDAPSFAVVSCDVLPEVFLRVMEVKRLIACGEEKSFVSACRRVGISRSAYYKYKDSVFTYEEKLTRRVFSLNVVLKDQPGVLSAVLTTLHLNGANIMTLNQSLPIDGAAGVTVTVRMDRGGMSGDRLKNAVAAVSGVVDVRVISEE